MSTFIVAMVVVLFAALVNADTPIVILSGSSMTPVLKPGDLVLLYRPHLSEIGLGDIVAYRDAAQTLVIHRVVDKGVDTSGSIYVITKGDSNQGPDDEKIDERNYAGKIYYAVSGAGKIINGFQNPMILALMLVTGCAYLLYLRKFR